MAFFNFTRKTHRSRELRPASGFPPAKMVWRTFQVCMLALLLIRPLSASSLILAQDIGDVKISLNLKNASLREVFLAIEGKTEFKFIASIEKIASSKRVSLTVEEKSVKEVLDNLLADSGLSFTQVNYNIVIRSKLGNKTSSVEGVLRQISGLVSDKNGAPLPGVNIMVKNTAKGTTTDVEGKYALSIEEENTVLVFSSIGYQTKEAAVGSQSVVNMTLIEDVTMLGEMVVTALGIEKESRSITYATQNITSEELNKVKDPNMMNSLAGKAAGVIITKGSAGPGSSTRVLLRGNKSITGNNQPLYVIDGIPMNNSSSTSSNTLFSQQDFGDAISNLNPGDIESIQVLKGASAAALYGSQAANGVILVTTKKGRKGVSSINFSSTTTLESPISLPKNQTTYGQKVPGVSTESWGAKITNGTDRHFSDFFETGKNFVNSLSISNGNNQGQFYVSYANTKATGIVPENKLTRHNANLRGTTQLLNDKLSLDGSVNYVNQKVFNRPQSGYYLSPIFSLYMFPTGDDFSKYSGNNYQKWDPVRLMDAQNWPYIVNEASSNQNPYWIQNKNQNDMLRERFISSFTAKYKILDWLNIQGRVTYDKVQDYYEQRLFATTDPVQAHANGGYSESSSNTNQLYSDVLVSANKNVGKNFFISAALGFSNTQNNFSSRNFSSVTSSGLAYANYFSVYGLKFPFNSAGSTRRTKTQALFGTATIGYKEALFLDVTARNEWSSTVYQDFFYPSVGLSYVLTETLGATDFLSFAKVRGSYSEVGNALPFGVANLNPGYTLSNDDNINPRGTLPYFSGSDTTNLQPERTRSYEFGTELRFFKDKLNVNLTYYNATTYDQVFTIQAPAGSGASFFYINGGTIKNKGIEGVVSYNAEFGPVKWTPSVNFSRNVNQIRELSPLLTTPRFVLTTIDATRQVQVFLTRPENGKYGSYGDLYGKRIQYNEDGTMQVDANGLPVLSPNPDQFIGNANPNFLAGFNNKFTYKNVSLSFLIDARFGGKIVSITETWRDWKGLSERTAEARDAGGVMVNGKLVDAEAYYKRISGSGQQGAAELYAYDATNIRLREFALGYSLPKFSNAIKEINISLVARNLFFFYKNAPFDPEVSIAPANGLQGIEGFNLPATRSYGVTLRATF